jgi:hypothetical protein
MACAQGLLTIVDRLSLHSRAQNRRVGQGILSTETLDPKQRSRVATVFEVAVQAGVSTSGMPHVKALNSPAAPGRWTIHAEQVRHLPQSRSKTRREVRTCTDCGETKPLTGFLQVKDTSRWYGLGTTWISLGMVATPAAVAIQTDCNSDSGETWVPIAMSGAPSPRLGHTAVWTGTEMIVWGGFGRDGELEDGAAFDPARGTWRSIASQGAVRAYRP